MFEFNIDADRAPASPESESNENMEPHDCDENFTNFSISEILKPDFGRKNLTAGVLNLSRERNRSEQTDKLSCFNWTSHPLYQFGLKFDAFTNSSCATNKLDLSRVPHNISQNKTYGLNLDVRNFTSTPNSPTESHNDRRRESCGGSDGESSISSPATSPTGSPGSSPESGKDSKGGAGKLWPAWVYCTRYSDRPSAGKTRTSFNM